MRSWPSLHCPLSAAYCSTHVQSLESSVLSPFLKGGCAWPEVCYRCLEEDVIFEPCVQGL